MHTIRFPIKTGKEKEKILDKGFRAMARYHNAIVKEAKKRIRMLQRDPEYRMLKAEYGKAAETKDDTKKKELGSQLNACIRKHGLTEQALQEYGAVYQKNYAHLISSHQAQEEASRVFEGVKKVLYEGADDIHYKKWDEIHTIASKSWNGLRYYDPYHTEYYKKGLKPRYQNEIEYHNTQFKVKINWKDPYVLESMQHEIKYIQIERKMFTSGWRYYIIVYLEGDPPVKHQSRDATAGMDIGVSTAAVAYDDGCRLIELAPECRNYNDQIWKLQKQIERSQRIHNPENYNDDGTLKKGKHRWYFSNTCIRKKRKLSSLHRKKAAYTKQAHEEVVNKLIAKANVFITEEMSFKALQRRSQKPVEKCDKEIQITDKNGIKKTVRKNKRKKRFGSSLRDRAPSEFMMILKRKCEQQGGTVITINTQVFRASQYDHSRDEYIKIPLSQRNKIIGSHKVQRDLYSAYLLSHSNKEGTKPDREECIRQFDTFLDNMNNCIHEIRNSGKSYPACFGF